VLLLLLGLLVEFLGRLDVEFEQQFILCLFQLLGFVHQIVYFVQIVGVFFFEDVGQWDILYFKVRFHFCLTCLKSLVIGIISIFIRFT